MNIIQQIPFAALGMGAAFTVLWGVADPMAAYAEVKVIETDGYYIMGDGPEENPAVAKERALADAKRAASEQAGTYVENVYEVKMSKLTRDEIRTISANVMELQEAEITPEAMDGSTIRYHCRMKTHVDASDITDLLHRELDLAESARQRKELEEQLAKVDAELAMLKEQYKTASDADRQEINRKVKRNEDEFMAVHWNETGVDLYNKKDYHGALPCFQKAIETDPDFAASWSNMGIAYTELGDYDKAIEYCQKAVELAPNVALSWLYMGCVYDRSSNNHRAIECFQKALELDRDFSTAWNNMGISYGELGNHDKEIECLQKAIELAPECIIALGNIGYTYHNDFGNCDKALECYQKAIEFNPKGNLIIWCDMGSVYDDLGNHDKAIRYYQKAIELDPNHPIPWNNLGSSYNDLGDYDKAIECCQKAIELDPNLATPWKHMGTSYYQLGNYAKAVEYFQKAIQLDPDYEGAKEGLSLAQAKL